MMNYYLLRGGDSSSDSGGFSVVTNANDTRQARTKLRHHLQACGRKDLMQKPVDCNRVFEDSNGVLYSDVEQD